jgi:hypothetical protein
MVLLRLTQIQIMSKNNEKKQTITLTDPDTGVTLSIPEYNVTTHDDDYITITTDSMFSDVIDTGLVNSSEFRSIYERPNEKTIRQRYVGHKKIDNISDIGIHTLEKMSKRGN